jgi:hypothetical protein
LTSNSTNSSFKVLEGTIIVSESVSIWTIK